MMNSIFQELLHKGVLANYMDDFVIPTKTMEELEERTVRFLKIAEKHNLCFKRSKCDIKAVKEWKTLTKVKDVESFLEFANFY